MEWILYWFARAVLALAEAAPLTLVARVGRVAGLAVYWLDARHRRVAIKNLTLCFGHEKSAWEVRALAKENFRRIGENFASAAKTGTMTLEDLRPHLEFTGAPDLLSAPAGKQQPGLVAAIGHFGNFELYARFGQLAAGRKCATTYRGFRQPSLNRLLQSLRAKSGCQFFDRRFEGRELRSFMNDPGVVLGLLADQHAGKGGLRLPFLGHECSTSTAPALFALRYDCELRTGICYRIGLARWRIEVGDPVPLTENGARRSARAIMLEVNRAFEAAVRRDPANWFWVHNRWKLARTRPQGEVAVATPAAPKGSEDLHDSVVK